MAQDIGTDLNFKNVNKITGLAAGTAPDHAVNKAQLDSVIENFKTKDPVRTSTQGNLNLASPGASIGGISLVAGDRVLVYQQTASSENGIYIWAGAASAMTRSVDTSTGVELQNATTFVAAGPDAGKIFWQSAVSITLGTTGIAWQVTNNSVAAASETASGIAELATQAEVDAGTDTLRIVTPKGLTDWSGRSRRMTSVIGDGTANQFDVTHNFGSDNVNVEVRYSAGTKATIITDVERPSINMVRIRFGSAHIPAVGEYTVVVKL
jgi:hypothetical protein